MMWVVNLQEWAAANGVERSTAYRWYKQGKLPVPATKVGGLILIGDLLDEKKPTQGKTVVYARVSSADQKSDLDRQVARITQWATEQDISIDKVVTEVGSALNGHRRKFISILEDPSITKIIVEHRDRFCRFGADYIAASLKAQNRELIVVDSNELDDDIVRDVTEILTSMCARLYGRRAAENKAKRAVKEVLDQ